MTARDSLSVLLGVKVYSKYVYFRSQCLLQTDIQTELHILEAGV